MSSNSDLYCLSGAWCLGPSGELAVLERPSDGTVIELEGVAPEQFAALWSTLQGPCAAVELARLFDAFGASGAELLELFQSEGVLRRLAHPPALLTPGAGALPELVAALARHGGWGLPALRCFSFVELLLPQPEGSAALGLASFGEHVVLVRLGCMHCALLRVLGVVGAPGEEQTERLAAPPSLAPDQLQALVAAVLLEAEREPLAQAQGVWARWHEGVSRGAVLAHPDCPRCESRAGVRTDWLRRELAGGPGVPTSAEHIAGAFGDSPFSPLSVVEAEGTPGQFPFDQPYVFGDTRLSRLATGRVFCTSIPGIVHGSASTVARSRMLAWSEGAERLAAQGARPDLVVPVDDARAVAVAHVFGEPLPGSEAPPSGVRALCHGLDLLEGSECWVPFDRVAVCVPAVVVPGGLPAESTFTGCASHVTARDALLHGTVELLKRDAHVVTWYRRRRLPEIQWPRSLPEELALRTEYLRRSGIQLRLYDLRADLPLPMVLLHARAERRVGHWPAGGSVLVPAGGFTPLAALGHALALTSSRLVGLAFDDSSEGDPLDPSAVERRGRTLAFWPGLARYLDPARASSFDFLGGGGSVPLAALETAPISDPFLVLQSWLRAAGLSWIGVPLPEPAALAAGLCVTKAIVPQALRLSTSAEPPDRNHPRLARDWPGATSGSWNDSPLPLY